MGKTSSNSKKTSKKPAEFVHVQDLFSQYALEDKGGYITHEFQDFGYRLAMELDDKTHVSLYMRLAKKEKRTVLEQALSFVSDAPNVRNKAALFMWKLRELRKEKKATESDNKTPKKKTPKKDSDSSL
jgi:hypothetical protein